MRRTASDDGDKFLTQHYVIAGIPKESEQVLVFVAEVDIHGLTGAKF